MLKRDSYFLIICLFATIGYILFITFYGITYTPICVTDEHRNSINALEMYQNGNFWYTTHDNLVDFWNTKPPLLIWLQVFFMTFFGPSELSVRLPTAFMGLGISAILFVFSSRYLNSLWIGIIANICLFSSNGFVSIHGLRTGDYDITLTFFILSMILSFYVYFSEKSKMAALIFSISLALAILTKSAAALLILPGMFLFLLVNKRVFSTLKDWSFIKTLFIPIITTIGYYSIREVITPGYFGAIWNNELSGRYLKVNEGHVGSIFYYWDLLKGFYWGKKLLIASLIALPIALLFNDYKKITFYLFICALCFGIILSISQTKIHWYLIPIYPILSLLIGISSQIIFKSIASYTKNHQFVKALLIVSIFGILYNGYMKFKITETLNLKTYHQETNYFEKLQQQAVKKGIKIDTSYTYLIIAKHIVFYERILNQNYKYLIVNKFGVNIPTKVATGILSIKQNIEDYYDVIDKKDKDGVSYYTLNKPQSFTEKKMKGFDFNKITTNEHGIAFIKNNLYANRMLIAKKSITTETNEFYYLDIYSNHDDQKYRCEFTINEDWDNQNYNGYSLKFIQLMYPASGGEIIKKNKDQIILWHKTLQF